MHESEERLHRNAHSRGILFHFKLIFFFLHKCALHFISNIRTNHCTERRCHKKALQQINSHYTTPIIRTGYALFICFIHATEEFTSVAANFPGSEKKTSEVNGLGKSFQLIICLLLKLTKLKQDDLFWI